MKKILALLLCLLMVVGCLSGCAGKEEAPAAPEAEKSETPAAETEKPAEEKAEETAESAGPKYQKTITIAINADMVKKDIQETSSVIDRSNSVLVFDTLIQYDPEAQQINPGLATEWEQTGDLEWTFKLREGVKFHNGEEFTAEDVQFTFERGFESSQAAPKINSVESVEVVDDYTVKLHMLRNDQDVLYKLADICVAIMNKDAFDAGVEDPYFIGTGPFKYVEWVQGDHVTLARFDEHWGGASNTEEIIMKYVPEAASRLVALQTGEVDLALEPPATDFHYISEDDNYTLYQINGTNLRYVWLNVNVAPFDNQLVRQAVACAINREDAIAMVYNGNATPAVNVMHPDNVYYDNSVTYQDYDVEKGKALLAEAGYPDGFECTLYSSTGNTQKAVATIVQSQLAAIGINAKVENLESAAFSPGVAPGGTFDMVVDGWGGYALGPNHAMRSVFHSEGPTTRCNINDPKLDELIERDLETTDSEERRQIHSEIQQYVMDLGIWVPIAVERINIATKASLEGFAMPVGTTENYRGLYIVEE